MECIKRLDIPGHVNIDLGSDEAVGGRGIYCNFSKWVRDNNLAIKEAISDTDRKVLIHRE